MAADQHPSLSACQIRLKVGARVHASDPYWPAMGRPVQKERVIADAREVAQITTRLTGPFWLWVDPKNKRQRWCRLDDAERVSS